MLQRGVLLKGRATTEWLFRPDPYLTTGGYPGSVGRDDGDVLRRTAGLQEKGAERHTSLGLSDLGPSRF